MFEGRLAERKEKMSSQSLESFHIFRVQGRFFGRCCRIAVSSVDGMRRLSPFYVNNDQIGITKVGWMIIIHTRAALLLNEFSRTRSPHTRLAAGTLIRDQAVTCAYPITANGNDKDPTAAIPLQQWYLWEFIVKHNSNKISLE